MILIGAPLFEIFQYGPDALNPAGLNLTLTDTTHKLTLPINCVLDGQQREPVSKLMGLDGAITGPLKGIFDE